jgi:hypothetical protein
MANEFIARKGLIVLANGAIVTGSLKTQGDIEAIGYSVTASAYTGSFKGDGSNLTGITATGLDIDAFGSDLTGITVASTDKLIISDAGTEGRINVSQLSVPLAGTGLLANSGTITLDTSSAHFTSGIKSKLNLDGVFSSSVQTDVRQTTGIATIATTGSNVFTSNQFVSGNLTFANDGQIRIVDNTDSTLFGFYDGSNLLGAYYQMWGNNHASADQRGSAEFVFDVRNSGGGFRIASFNGVTWTKLFEVNKDGNTNITGSLSVTGPVTASAFTGSFFGDGSGLTGIASTLALSGSTGNDVVNLKTEALTINGSNGITTTVTDNTVTVNLPAGTVSASSQIDVRNTTGIATIATTGSNTFTGVQTITNTTNSTNYTDGALIVYGGVGIAKDVNISGSLNVTGVLTATTMSTQYVTSSQYVVGVSRILLNDDDLVRFSGISVVDSGSTFGTGSLLWDSLNNRWIYQADDQAYNSAVIIAGPKNTGNLGDEPGLTVNRVPVASGDDHIDSRIESSSIRVDFPSRLTHVEAGLVITGSVTSSVGFSGDGSQLTGIVTNLNLTGSEGGTGTVSLKTQALTIDGTNGIAATVSGQTITISGSDATTSAKGVAQFNGSHFVVNGGIVSASAITFNSVPLYLGSSYSFALANITSQGATTADQLTLNGGAVIHGVLFTSGSNTDVDTGTEVVATVSTGSRDAAFFDYVVKNGVNYRAGTVMAVWDGSNNVEFTDTSTNDIGNTGGVTLSVDALAGSVRLKATVTSDNWIIKTAVRAF